MIKTRRSYTLGGVEWAYIAMAPNKFVVSRGQAVLILVLFVAVVVGVGILAGLLGHDCPGARDSGEHGGQGAANPFGHGEEPWTDHRLPSYTLPIHYDLKLFPDFYDNHTRFYGDVTVRINVTKDTNYLLIHYKMMNVTHTDLKDYNRGKSLGIKRNFTYAENEYWVVETKSTIGAGSVVSLHVVFDGSLTNGIVGLYRSTYINSNTGQRRQVHYRLRYYDKIHTT